MLALAYAAAHPSSATALVLVGCGTFHPLSRARPQATLAKRANSRAPYDYAAIDTAPEDTAKEPFDELAHTQSREEMVRLQTAGVYPAAFTAISSPVLTNAAWSLRPAFGSMIRDSPRPHRLTSSIEFEKWPPRCLVWVGRSLQATQLPASYEIFRPAFVRLGIYVHKRLPFRRSGRIRTKICNACNGR
jgi:pimeloyl-ACP methyl ester carboxylesterase